MTIVEAEQLGGVMTDKLAELFGEEEAKKAKAAAQPQMTQRDRGGGTRSAATAAAQAVKRTALSEVAKGRRAGS